MGDYKPQYEKYYNNMRNKLPGKAPKREGVFDSFGGKGSVNVVDRLAKKFIMQLGGALMLLVLFLAIKMIPLEGTKEAYIVSKEAISKDLDINEAVMAINIPVVKDYKETALDYIDEFKSFVTGEKTLKESIKEEYIVPVLGSVKSLSGENTGVIIQTDGDKDIIASFDGKVREVKEEGSDKHIILDHGNGIETYYGLISKAEVKVGDKVKKGQLIGKTGAVDSEDTKGMVYKVIFMGIEKDPLKFMDFSSLQKV